MNQNCCTAIHLPHVVKNQAMDAIRSTMDIPSTSRWYVVFLGARFKTRKAVVDDPRIDANAVNFGAIATAFCWARVDISRARDRDDDDQ